RLGWPAGPAGGDDAARGALAATAVEQLLDALTDAGGPLEYLPPDRLVHVERLTAGIVLTHRLTNAEADLGVLTAGFDLAGFARRGELRLPGGTELDVFSVEDGHLAWQGPDGWLDAYGPGRLLAVRISDEGTVDLSELAAEPAPDGVLASRLRAVYDTEVAEPGLPVSAEMLVLGLLAEDRHTFADPRPPLAELCQAAGLEGRGGHVAHDESVWQAGIEHALTGRILDRLDGDAARTALRILRGAGDDDPSSGELRDTLAGLAEPGVADVVLDELIPGPGVDDDAGDDLIDAVRDAASAWADRLLGAATSPAEIALARWVAAVVAERREEVLVAEAHLALAIEADSGFEPALVRAAWYASDRGDAARALRLWRRLETADPDDLDMVAPFTRPTKGDQPGRNQACWCGSGRKYKTCHLGQAPPAPLPERVGWLCHKAVGYLKHAGPGAAAAVVACALARAVDPDDAASIAETLDDPIVLDAVLTEGGWFERFLANRGPLLPDDEAALAASWNLCTRTVYEIVAVSAGAVLSVVDLRSGDHLEVRERTFSRPARPGTLVCARAVPDGHTHQFVGAVFPVAPGREGDVLD
ncbi:MAG: SEC-C metal-binding domain-containing protein, partial [Acidimicrobiales bacterium]